MIDTSFLHQLDRMHILIRRKVNGAFQGNRQSNVGGQGLIIKDFTQYSTGDDFRKIDWKVFARTDKLYIKRFEEERNLTIHVLIDTSGSMNFGQKTKKSEYAGQIGVAYGYMALRNNERFLLSTFADTLELFKPKKGRKQLAAMVDYLNTKRSENISNFGDTVSKYYKTMVHSRSLIVIVSDFLYDTNQLRAGLSRIKGHDVILIQVLDPVERELNIEGDFRLVDSETHTQMRTFVSSFIRKRYLQSLADHNESVSRIAAEVGGRFYTFTTDNPIFDTCYTLFQ